MALDSSGTEAYRPGDIVFFIHEGKSYPWHVAIISEGKTAGGIPRIYHGFPPFASGNDLVTWYGPIMSRYRWKFSAE